MLHRLRVEANKLMFNSNFAPEYVELCKILKDDDCFNKMSYDDALKIFEALGIDEENYERVYLFLIEVNNTQFIRGGF